MFIPNLLVEGVKEYYNDFCGGGTRLPEIEWPRQGIGHGQDELGSSGWLYRTGTRPVTCRLLAKEAKECLWAGGHLIDVQILTEGKVNRAMDVHHDSRMR